ncbi:bifunctional tetrahydrofolate synthase/dihydrofolate synthase [Pseudidiomarina insulisalsae]|uniref:Dihydrofolate synthase/folylpolyglutamate synthase n=1 Tax=Pseudidiomarina insulisalsae TaxID=575789 RepID=A0A432YM11_9GAMM|nr:bifunctional tetrahydrofolate synthase/dihydrofolate synthase [Pseudidiomarina insulisalsae]RUO61928.1 bifunctional tetrahydrofolate synthase/dihydrofolate synthase [Pseudidiomarina insulisalsae]
MNAQLTPPSAAAGLDAWLSYLEALHPKEIELGLERIKTVAQRLAVDPGAAKVITVAGTNGKGSTVRYLETVLRNGGYQTGVYISPHLVNYEERVRINGLELEAQQHVNAFQAVERARGDTSLTYFEFGTLAAFWLMMQAPLDVWILEVGLGGRLDAVNCLAADVGIVTSVGIDHVDFLGPDRTSIAREKAGIFRADKIAIIGEADFPPAILSELKQAGIAPLSVGEDFNYRLALDAGSWDYFGHRNVLRDLPLPHVPLPNAATAICALEQLELPVSEQAIRQGLAQAREKGRLQFQPGKPDVLIDVAHNPHAATFLATHIKQRFSDRRVYLVIGMLKDKDIQGTLAALADVVDDWYLADLSGARAASAQQLASALPASVKETDAQQFSSVKAAYQAACSAASDDQQQALVLVCGSFYTVSQIPLAE